MSAELIVAKQVTRQFVSEVETVHAVENVDMAAHAGEFICLFGHSGSGKTTFLNIMAGIDVPTSGSLSVDGLVVSELGEEGRIRLRREKVGMVHQTDFLIEEFTAIENVALPLEARGVATTDALMDAAGLLSRMGLEGYEGRLPRQLSGGQRQRVGIARALTGGRKVLLADEPTGALDSRNAAAIYSLLRDLCDEQTLVIVASHDPACRDYATRLVEMKDGQIVIDEALC